MGVAAARSPDHRRTLNVLPKERDEVLPNLCFIFKMPKEELTEFLQLIRMASEAFLPLQGGEHIRGILSQNDRWARTSEDKVQTFSQIARQVLQVSDYEGFARQVLQNTSLPRTPKLEKCFK